KGNPFKRTAFVSVNTVLLIPIPRAIVTIAINVNPGFFTSIRNPYLKSCRNPICNTSRWKSKRRIRFSVNTPPERIFRVNDEGVQTVLVPRSYASNWADSRCFARRTGRAERQAFANGTATGGRRCTTHHHRHAPRPFLRRRDCRQATGH